MRKSLWTIALLFAAIVAPNAHATALTFTGTSLNGQGELIFVPGVGNVLTIGAGSGGNGALITDLSNTAGLCSGDCLITGGYLTLETGPESSGFSGGSVFSYDFGSGGTIDIYGGIPSLSISQSLLFSASFLPGTNFGGTAGISSEGVIQGSLNLGSISLNPTLGTYNYTAGANEDISLPINSSCGFGGFCTGSLLLSVVGLDASPTPEPSSLVLFGTGLLGLAGVIRRKLCA